MSRENGSPQEGPAQNSKSPDNRRSSLWHIPTLMQHGNHSDPSGLNRKLSVKHVHTDALSDLDHGPLNMKDVIKEGIALADSPDDARSWLVGFGHLKSNTDVSLSFKDLREDRPGSAGFQSLLSLLLQWLPLWIARAERVRKEKGTSKSSNSREQLNFEWLLLYICDYLELGHTSLDQGELSQLVERITSMCLSASRQSDINAGIAILHTIICNAPFPEDGLEQTLVVLCASANNLQDAPQFLFESARLLLAGPLREESMTALFGFMRTPRADNNGKNLSHARGATRLLRFFVDDRDQQDGYIVDLAALLEELHSAASQSIFRYGNDILTTVHAILSSAQRRSEVLGLDWSKIVATVELCLLTAPTTSTASNALRMTLMPMNSQDEEARQRDRHLRDRDVICKRLSQDFARLWQDVSAPNRETINELVLTYAKYADPTLLAASLESLRELKLQSDDPEQRRVYSDKIYSQVVQNRELSSACRLKGIEVLVHVSGSADDSTPPAGMANSEAYTWILNKLVDQLDTENDSAVFATLLTSLEFMANNYRQAAKETALILTTVEKLEDIVLNGPATGLWSDDLAVLGTKVLVTIFSYGIHTTAEVAIKSFQALLDIAGPGCKARLARLVAKRLLFRIRADDAGFVYITGSRDSQYIASALCRTRESAEIFGGDTPGPHRHSASSTSLSSKTEANDVLWMYPDTEDESFPFEDRPSEILNVDMAASPQGPTELDMDTWLMNIIRCLQSDVEWETYSYTIVHLASQLTNIALFLNSLEAVVKLRQVLCEQVVNMTFREPPASTGLKKSDSAICIFNVLTSLIPYATMRSGTIQKGYGDDLVRAFLSGLGATWEGTSRGCIHALTICSFEIPSSVASIYPTIVDRLSKNMTQSHLTTHILEFLTAVSLLPELHNNFNPDEIQMIFGVCIQFLEKTRDQNHHGVTSPSSGRASTAARNSGMYLRRPPFRAAMLAESGVPQYAAALAYHVMIFWFLALRLAIRSKYVSWIVPRLVWKNSKGEDAIDEQSLVLIDMMQRTAYSDLGETSPDPSFAKPEDGPVNSASWIVGLSIVTAQTAGTLGKTQITKRQASGTTYAMYQQMTAQIPSHHRPSRTEIRNDEVATEMLPSHIILQMVATAAATDPGEQPISLPDEDYVTRALDMFDRIPTVASHKIGVLYIGEGQSKESDYLGNTAGSPDYQRLLDGLGYVVSLEPPLRFNPQGLEYPRDGTHTIAWRDRVSEIVYHVPTMMPTDTEDDPQCITKKAHVGNCHVNIVFNRSGSKWEMDMFQSQLNYINIVITPTCKARAQPSDDSMPAFYRVQLITRDGIPKISPAAESKVISAAQLPKFVRIMAWNASIFSMVWNTKDSDPEFPSTWRARLQQIKMLKERVVAKKSGGSGSGVPSLASISSPVATHSAPGGRRTPVPREDAQGHGKEANLASQLDFSSWTL